MLLALVAISPTSQAGANLPPVDNFLTTMFDKSVIAGSIDKDPATGMIAMDGNGNMKFSYSGSIHAVTTGSDATLNALGNVVGSIQGQASFPMSFACLAMGMKSYLDGVGPMPSVPYVIDWTCNTCTMVIGGTTYRSIVDVSNDAGAVAAMRLQGRAFTGLGPVEVGGLSAQSMSVRMAGCSAVMGVSGPNSGKVGTLCLNGTFTFDLSGINLANPMASDIRGTGTSNCVTVLHTPMQM